MAHVITEFGGYVSLDTGNSTSDPSKGTGIDAPWIIPNIPLDLHKHFVAISVYADEEKKHPLSPNFPTGTYKITAGTATVKASINNTVFGSVDGGTYDLANPDSRVPNCCGCVSTFSVDIKGLKPKHIEESHGCYVLVQVHSY